MANRYEELDRETQAKIDAFINAIASGVIIYNAFAGVFLNEVKKLQRGE